MRKPRDRTGAPSKLFLRLQVQGALENRVWGTGGFSENKVTSVKCFRKDHLLNMSVSA